MYSRCYGEYEWCDYTPWNDMIECDVKTESLINKVNKYNEEKYQKDRNSFKYEYIAKLTTAEEVKKAMLILFEEKNPSKEFWIDLSKLVNAIGESEVMNSALHLILKEDLPLPVRVKAKHFETMYTENCFYLYEERLLAKQYYEENNIDY